MTIDAHIHIAPPKLPGVSPMPVLLRPPEDVAAVVRDQMAAAGVTAALAMGSLAVTDDDPLGIAASLRVAERLSGLYLIGAVDPRHGESVHLQRVEREIAA